MSDFVAVPHFQDRGRGRGRGSGGRGGRHARGGRGRGRGGRGFHRGRGGGGRGRGGGGGRGRENEIFQEFGTPSESSINVAIQGCCHGELETIYARLLREGTPKIDLLICCGDFQSLRTFEDFHSYAAPPKYHQLGTFYKYYSGHLTAPILTIFIGGNHENSQQLQELYYGGWVAPNIYYLGAAGVVQYKGLRIGGISGIYKSHDYNKGHYELPPFNRNTLRSIYHVRALEVQRMKCLTKGSLDVMISHDWPQGIEQHGNTRDLIRRKPYFLNEINTNSLGSPPNREILEALRPKHWFAAHLHVGFQATMKHGDGGKSETKTVSAVTDLIPSQAVQKKTAPPPETPVKESDDVPNEEEAEAKTEINSTQKPDEDSTSMQFCQPINTEEVPTTKFISLDKCLPGRAYLAIAHLEPSITTTPPATENETETSHSLYYDPEWLAILRTTHLYTDPNATLPPTFPLPSKEDLEWAQAKAAGPIPSNFVQTVPPAPPNRPRYPPPPFPRMGNPQTDQFLQRMELDHILTIPYEGALPVQPMVAEDENEIDLDDGEEAEETISPAAPDDNEIELDNDNDNDDEAQGEENKEEESGLPPKKPRLDEGSG